MSAAHEPLRIEMVDPSLFSPPYDIELCASLADLGHRVTLHARQPRPNETDPAQRCPVVRDFYAVSEGLRRSRSPMARLAGPVKVAEHALDLARLARQVGRGLPAVVHVQWLVVPGVDAIALRRLRRVAPVIVTVHNTVPMHGERRARVQTAGWAPALAAADWLIVHTDVSRAALIDRGLPEDRIAVVPHGLLPTERAGGRRTVSEDADVVEVLLFGRLRPYKGADLLIDALARLTPRQKERVRVRVVGEPLMPVEPLRAHAEKAGVAAQIDWDLRFVPDEEIAQVFDGADIIVFPYREIDASGGLMKALTHGKAIVATDVGGFSDLLVDGVSAMVVPNGDAAAFARALGALVEDRALRDRLGSGATATAGAVPSWAEIAGMTVDVYRAARRHHRAAS